MIFRRPVLAWSVVYCSLLSVAVAPPVGAADWQTRADEVARRRLDRAHTAASAALREVQPVFVAERPQGGAIELRPAMLAADVPESQPATECPEACAIERGPLPDFWDTVKRDVKEMPGLLWHDTKKVYLNPWNVVFLVGAGGASLALRPEVDDDIEDFYHPNPWDTKHTMSKGWRNFFDAAGNPGTAFAVAGAFYLTGQMFQDIKTYEVGKRMASALIITDLTTVFLKLCAADTKAPNGLRYAWPSGHMSSTMALATVLNHAYGPVVGVPMYGFAALAGIERLDDREHDFSDVVFGAALGWVVAETVMKEHRPEIFGGEIVPYVDPNSGSSGVAWIKSIGE